MTWDSALTTVTVNHQPEAAVWGRRVASSGKLGPSARLGSGFLPKFTGAGGYAVPAVDPAGEFGVIWVGGSVGSLVQARFGH